MRKEKKHRRSFSPLKKNNLASDVLSSFLDFIFPPRCAVCRKKAAGIICEPCMDAMPLTQPPFCFRCGKSLKGKNAAYPLCADCRMNKHKLYFHSARAAGMYEGNLRRAIFVYKYQGNKKLLPALAGLLFSFLNGESLNTFSSPRNVNVKDDDVFPDVHALHAITFVPMDAQKQKQRGFNQAELLALELSRKFSLPLIYGLRKRKGAKAQVSLSEKERWENVRGIFSVDDDEKEKFKGKSILLVDDVLTTGATASECSRVLRKCGAEKIVVATLANTS